MKKYFWLATLTILALTLAMRFHRLLNRFPFGLDEEYQALLAYEQVLDPHPIWTGVSVADLGYYLGPGFTYATAILLKLSGGRIEILALAGTILGAMICLAIILMGKAVVGDRAGLIMGVIYAITPELISWDQRWWNPSGVMLLSTLMLWAIYNLQKRKYGWLVLAYFVLGASYHIHISLWIYWPWVIFYTYKALVGMAIRPIIVGFVILGLLYSPLLVFDLNHNLDNLRMPIRIFEKMVSATNSTEKAFDLTLVWKSAAILAIGWLVAKKKQSWLTGLLCVYEVFLLFYPGEIFPWYKLALYPMVLLGVGILSDKIRGQLIIISLALFAVWTTSQTYLEENRFAAKLETIQKISEFVGDKAYSLKTDNNYREDAGWRYLTEIYFKAPVKSSADEVYGWIYQHRTLEEKPQVEVTISNGTLKL